MPVFWKKVTKLGYVISDHSDLVFLYIHLVKITLINFTSIEIQVNTNKVLLKKKKHERILCSDFVLSGIVSHDLLDKITTDQSRMNKISMHLIKGRTSFSRRDSDASVSVPYSHLAYDISKNKKRVGHNF